MSEFTKGKWEVVQGAGIDEFDVISEDEPLHNHICILFSSPTSRRDEQKANARLIAAAPEMYEKLKDYAEVLEELSKMKDEENSKDDCLVCSNWAVVRIGEVISLINRIEKGNEANG